MASYDIALFKGHGKSAKGFDNGAVNGSTTEYSLNSLIVDKALAHLKNTKLSVLTGENNYENVLLKGHTIKSKYAVTVHINAGGGKRTELYVPLGEKMFDTEVNIGTGMVKLGIPTYQIKSRNYDTEAYSTRANGSVSSGKDYYKEIRDAWAMGISLTIFEVGFIDSTDLTVIKNNIDKIAFLLAKEMAKVCSVSLVEQIKVEPIVAEQDVIYRVIAGSYKQKSNAEIQIQKLKKAGFDCFIEAKK